MKSTAPTHPSHIRSPAIHTRLPQDSRAPCVVCKKHTRGEESYLYVWSQQEWHSGTDSFGDSIKKVSHSLAILIEPRGRRKYQKRGSP